MSLLYSITAIVTRCANRHLVHHVNGVRACRG
jgi:hypothetical protein